MAKEKLAAGLEGQEVEKVTKRRVYTAEEVAAIEAGLQKLEELGLDAEALRVLKSLAPVWHGEDKEALALAKVSVIESFPSNEAFKDFIEGPFKQALLPFAGIVKLIPVANNIGTFYARRKSSPKAKTVRIAIDGQSYDVNAEFFNSISEKSRDEKRELVLSHPETKVVKQSEIVEL